MALPEKTQHVWLHLVPKSIRKDKESGLNKAHDFTIERMTKTGPASHVARTGRVMVKVGITIDPDLFNQAVIEANMTLNVENLVPVLETEVEVYPNGD